MRQAFVRDPGYGRQKVVPRDIAATTFCLRVLGKFMTEMHRADLKRHERFYYLRSNKTTNQNPSFG